MTTYQYQRLQKQPSEIRLLTILPGELPDDIWISLRNVPISQIACPSVAGDNDVDCPGIEYEALSYTWGSNDGAKQVFVAGASVTRNIISITRNLDDALRRLRRDTASREVWIDAICVNQNDTVERGHQVSLMGYIYRLARNVIVWLGPERDDSSHALETLDQAGRGITVDWYTSTVTNSESGEVIGPGNLVFSDRAEKAIGLLVMRSWFERLWVRQEIYLATNASLMCGDTTMPWLHFENAVYRWVKMPYNERVVAQLPPEYTQATDGVMRLCSNSHARLNYSGLRSFLKGLKWSDDRDVIYAVLHLMSEEDSSLGVSPDYTVSAATVFTDVAMRKVKFHKDLRFLDSCVFNDQSPADLPSWVPDWASSKETLLGYMHSWSACAWISAQAEVVGPGNSILSATGVPVDTIATAETLPLLETEFDVSAVFRCVKYLLSQVDLSAQYVGGSSFLETYNRLFYARAAYPEELEDDQNEPRSGNQLRATLKALSTTEELIGANKEEFRHYLEACFRALIGRCFFRTEKGFIGLAPTGTKTGDLVCVLLGCRRPLILRGLGTGPRHFQLVGGCFVPGLMQGEAIHGPLPTQYRPVRHGLSSVDRIQGAFLALKDEMNGTFLTDPSLVLKQLGIIGATYQREPHILEVPYEVLRGAGVPLEKFSLV
ncbi:heterokaryon incompatibility protein-domain-containing protein [Xylaria scruposa]|nr:heterokaryon incompatibility protein-domain-containing protein [Xylaria scruposa]